MKNQHTKTFQVFLLGAPDIRRDGVPIHLNRRKALALFAYLAVMEKPVSRNEMAALLSPESDTARANAELRRAWAALKEIGLGEALVADREYLAVGSQQELWIDVREFNHLAQQTNNIDLLQRIIDLYRGDFMAGFSLRGNDAFYEWQMIQTHGFQRKYLAALERLAQLYTSRQAYEDALPIVERLLAHDFFNESVQQQAMRLYASAGQIVPALRLYEDYRLRLREEIGVNPQPETEQLYEGLRSARPHDSLHVMGLPVGNVPPVPPLVLGREQAIADLKRLIRRSDAAASPIVVQGWPGIGKTTVAATIARDAEVQDAFPGGVLWVALGQSPDILVELQTCMTALGLPISAEYESPEMFTARLATVCQDRQMLLIVDDVWDVADFAPFNFMGAGSATLVTTRANGVAQRIVVRPDHIYKLPILSEAQSLDLLRVLAPEVVEHNLEAVRELINALEGLPLALQVAGRLLRAEYSMGWDVTDLLEELRAGTRLLAEQPPLDRKDILQETTPTVATLLRRSTDRLDTQTKERFALLGVFAPKPAAFDLDALRAVWEVDDPKPSVRILVDRGLMEPIGGGEFQIHALLVAHAKSLFARYL